MYDREDKLEEYREEETDIEDEKEQWEKNNFEEIKGEERTDDASEAD